MPAWLFFLQLTKLLLKQINKYVLKYKQRRVIAVASKRTLFLKGRLAGVFPAYLQFDLSYPFVDL